LEDAALLNDRSPDGSRLFRLLQGHFGADIASLPIVEQKFAFYERPNLHLALQEIIAGPKRQARLVGVVTLEEYRGPSLAKLCREASARFYDQGPVEYLDVDLPGNNSLTCVKTGLYLIENEDGPVAALITEQQFSWPPGIVVEVMAADRELAAQFIRRVTGTTRRGTAYRGHVLSLAQDVHGVLHVEYHQLPQIERDELILPEKLMDRIERHTVAFTRHAEKLLAAKRHLKRGLLFYGPPGTGKTLSAMYLISQMHGRTVLLLTGGAMCSIETVSQFARMLAPSTIVLEDVDLIGTERPSQTVGANALLFELLNQMDGLADDEDILFILTTNRPEILEPALAARPGRIDQAIEFPPPDAECRRRLFELYGRGLQFEVGNWDTLIERTAGASGAFIRELLRKSAVFAAEESDDGHLIVKERHINEALTELLVGGGALTQSLLGMSKAGKNREFK
jgi:cell division protease FtsH